MPAEQHRLRDPRHLHAADGERGPDHAGWDLGDHGGQQGRLGRGAVGDAHAELVHGRGIDQALVEELVGEPQLPAVEDLQLGPDAQLLDASRPGPQHVRCGHVDQAALAEVETAAVQGADVGPQLFDVRQPFDAADQVGALGEAGRVGRVQVQVATHARGGVDHHVDVAGPQPPHDLPVQRHLSGPGAGARVPDVHVHDGRPGPGRLDRRRRDLLRRDRDVLGLAHRVASPGQRAGDDDLAVHGPVPSRVESRAVSAMVARAR